MASPRLLRRPLAVFTLLGVVSTVAFTAAGVDLGLVEVGAKVVVAGLGIGEQVPDDGQDRVADRDDGPALAEPPRV